MTKGQINDELWMHLIRTLRERAEVVGAEDAKLMQEAADEFERLLPLVKSFKSFTEELQHALGQAEEHTREAHDLIYKRGVKRPFRFTNTLRRTRSSLLALLKQERDRKGQ